MRICSTPLDKMGKPVLPAGMSGIPFRALTHTTRPEKGREKRGGCVCAGAPSFSPPNGPTARRTTGGGRTQMRAYLQQQQPFFWSMTWKASASAKTVTSG